MWVPVSSISTLQNDSLPFPVKIKVCGQNAKSGNAIVGVTFKCTGYCNDGIVFRQILEYNKGVCFEKITITIASIETK